MYWQKRTQKIDLHERLFMKKLKGIPKPLLKRTLFSLITVLVISGCSTITTSYLPPLPANLSEPCRKSGLLTGTSGDVIFELLMDNAYKLRECDAGKQAVVDYYEEMRKVVNGKG